MKEIFLSIVETTSKHDINDISINFNILKLNIYSKVFILLKNLRTLIKIMKFQSLKKWHVTKDFIYLIPIYK